MIKIAILASGEGTNAENMIRYFQKKKTAEVVAVFANKRHVGVYRRVEPLGVQAQYVPNADFSDGKALQMLQERKVDFIVLAGFLFKIPDDILVAYPDRIVNVHPALLPKHGGKGMYGNKVHAAVIADGDLESGITIHYIDGNYDEGKTLFQAKCPVLPDDTPETLAQRIHHLEHTYYPQVVEAVVSGKPLDKLTL